MSGFLLHKAMYQIHSIGMGESMDTVAESHRTSKSAVRGNLNTFYDRLGQIFWSRGRGFRNVPCDGADDFLKKLDALIERHNKMPKVGTESDAAFVFTRCLTPKLPFMHPSIGLLIQLSRGMTPDEIVSEEGWTPLVYKRLRASLHRIGETPDRLFMNKKMVLSDELLAAARVAEGLLPYHMELYAEALNLPKLSSRGAAHAHIKKGGGI